MLTDLWGFFLTTFLVNYFNNLTFFVECPARLFSQWDIDHTHEYTVTPQISVFDEHVSVGPFTYASFTFHCVHKGALVSNVPTLFTAQLTWNDKSSHRCNTFNKILHLRSYCGFLNWARTVETQKQTHLDAHAHTHSWAPCGNTVASRPTTGVVCPHVVAHVFVSHSSAAQHGHFGGETRLYLPFNGNFPHWCNVAVTSLRQQPSVMQLCELPAENSHRCHIFEVGGRRGCNSRQELGYNWGKMCVEWKNVIKVKILQSFTEALE